MPYALREGDKVNVYIGCGKYADVEVGTIVIHNKRGRLLEQSTVLGEVR